MTKVERIQDLLGQVEDDTRKAAMKDCDPDEVTGIHAAIEIIEANHIH